MEFSEAYQNLFLKFKSGNDVPVTRATITREEWEAVSEELRKLDRIISEFCESGY